MPDGDLDELKFDAEELIAYELGAKSSWLDRSLTLNGAVFFQDYTDKQIPVQTIDDGFPFVSLTNAGEAEVFGIELEAVWQVTEQILVQGAYTYLDGEYTDLVYLTNSGNSISRAGNCTPSDDGTLCAVNLNGRSLEDIPQHAFVGLVGFYPPLGDTGLNGLVEADVLYQSSRYADEFNDREVSNYSVYNLRAGVETEAWDVLVYVNNVFDDDTIRSWAGTTGLVATAERTNPNLFAFPAEGFSIGPSPRQWGVRASLRF